MKNELHKLWIAFKDVVIGTFLFGSLLAIVFLLLLGPAEITIAMLVVVGGTIIWKMLQGLIK